MTKEEKIKQEVIEVLSNNFGITDVRIELERLGSTGNHIVSDNPDDYGPVTMDHYSIRIDGILTKAIEN